MTRPGLFHVKHTDILPDHTPPPALEAIAGHLFRAAAPLGFTGHSDAFSFLHQGMMPALALSRMFRRPLLGQWLEIGSGSGAIGLSLATMHPAAHFTLADRRERVIAHLDLAVRRLGVPNADILQADLRPGPHARRWLGVCFRALASPREALQLAAHYSSRCICAWHSPRTGRYDVPPSGFHLAARAETCTPGLVATLYCRDRPSCAAPSAGQDATQDVGGAIWPSASPL